MVRKDGRICSGCLLGVGRHLSFSGKNKNKIISGDRNSDHTTEQGLTNSDLTILWGGPWVLSAIDYYCYCGIQVFHHAIRSKQCHIS